MAWKLNYDPWLASDFETLCWNDDKEDILNHYILIFEFTANL